MPLRIWDEARIAVTAYEMYNSGNLLIPFYDGEPDMWSTKPPMLPWMQVIAMHILGPSELSVRIPVALSAFVICLIFIFFSSRYLEHRSYGILSALILVSSYGFVHIHMSRTGDYDVLLSLFVFASALSYYQFIDKNRPHYLYTFFILLAFGVLTKSISGLFLVPSLVVYTLYKKHLQTVLKEKHFYLSLLTFVFIVGGYYALREYYNPGYLSAVWNNELGGRFSKALESHAHNSWFYLQNLFHEQYSYWVFLIPLSVYAIFKEKSIKLRQFGHFTLFMAFGFLLVISSAKTKIFWYDAALFPFLALINAFGLIFIYRIIAKKNRIIAVLVYPLLIAYPYLRVIDKTFLPKESDYNENAASYEIGYIMKEAVEGKTELNDYTYVYYDYNAHVLFYQYLLSEQHRSLKVKAPESLEPGEKVMAYQPAVKHYIKMYYEVELIDKKGDVEFLKIIERI